MVTVVSVVACRHPPPLSDADVLGRRFCFNGGICSAGLVVFLFARVTDSGRFFWHPRASRISNPWSVVTVDGFDVLFPDPPNNQHVCKSSGLRTTRRGCLKGSRLVLNNSVGFGMIVQCSIFKTFL
jgi:hypothetical protein